MENFKEIANKVIEGEIDALKAYIELKRIDKELKSALAKIQDLALSEAEKYESKTFDAFNAEINVRNAAGRWDFKHLDWWIVFQAEQGSAKQAYELSLKSKTMIDPDGEIVQPAKYMPGKTTIAIKLK